MNYVDVIPNKSKRDIFLLTNVKILFKDLQKVSVKVTVIKLLVVW